MSKKKKATALIPPTVDPKPTAAEATPTPSMSEDLLWQFLAALTAARAAQVCRATVQNSREKSGVISLYPPDDKAIELVRQFAGQVALNERTQCCEAAKKAAPEQGEAIASALSKRGPLGFTLSFVSTGTEPGVGNWTPGWTTYALAE